MNSQVLTIMMAGIDIWAMLFVLHYRPGQAWEVTVAVANPNQPPGSALTEPEQIWLTRDRLGIWPDMQRPLTLDQVQSRLKKTAESGRRVEVRLLCDPALTLQEWGRVAVALSRHAEEVRIAPLPRTDPSHAQDPRSVFKRR